MELGPQDPARLDPALLQGERNRAYLRGFNLGLLLVVLPGLLWAVFQTLIHVPRFESVFRQVNVPMPGLTLLVVRGYVVVCVVLLLIAAVCFVATLRLGHRSFTVGLNIACAFLSLAWLALLHVSLSFPLLSLLEGIGRGR